MKTIAKNKIGIIAIASLVGVLSLSVVLNSFAPIGFAFFALCIAVSTAK